MGGCYNTSYDYSSRSYNEESKPNWKISVGKNIAAFFKDHDLEDLVKAYTAYQENNTSGFIKLLLEKQGCAEAPKEFPEIEYEIKFTLTPTAQKKGLTEPGMEKYLDAFQFPPVNHARLLKDPVNTLSEGTNHFFGKGDEEHLVVIEKGGKLYLKEKSQPLPLTTKVPYQDFVIKRTEKRYEAQLPDIFQKIGDVLKSGATYHGRIRKEKADAFVLDTNDGRIYSFTITRAHLGDKGPVQRQLEIEYAGYIPDFPQFTKDNEAHIIAGMLGIAKHVSYFGNNAPLAKNWALALALTHERKYDFVKNKEASPALEHDFVPLLLPNGKTRRTEEP